MIMGNIINWLSIYVTMYYKFEIYNSVNYAMLIINVTNYSKPYIVMQVGRTKFIIQPKLSVLIITHKHVNIFTVYRNGTLLGRLAYYGIYTAQCDGRDGHYTEWSKYILCGTIYGLNTPHNVPFYEYSDGVSIFGYRVTQYQYDGTKYKPYNKIHEKIILQI